MDLREESRPGRTSGPDGKDYAGLTNPPWPYGQAQMEHNAYPIWRSTITDPLPKIELIGTRRRLGDSWSRIND